MLFYINLYSTQVATYAAWLVGGVSFGYVRREIIDPKFASGEWSLPFQSKTDAAIEAASTLTSKAANVIEDGISIHHTVHDSFDYLA